MWVIKSFYEFNEYSPNLVSCSHDILEDRKSDIPLYSVNQQSVQQSSIPSREGFGLVNFLQQRPTSDLTSAMQFVYLVSEKGTILVFILRL